MTGKTAIITGNSASVAAAVGVALADSGVASVVLDLDDGAVIPSLIDADRVIPSLDGRRFHVIDDPQMPVEVIVGDEVPDRVSIERPSAHWDPCVDNLGVRIDGIEQDSVVEYCVSGGWARIGERDHRGKLIWEFDHYRARCVEGVKVEPYWRRALSRQQRRARAAKARKAR